MLSVRPCPPVDYSKCSQTVTVYHWDGDHGCTRTVYKQAFLDFKKTQNVDKTGQQGSQFLPAGHPVLHTGRFCRRQGTAWLRS